MSLQVRMNARLRMKLVSMNRSDHITSVSYPVKISSKSVKSAHSKLLLHIPKHEVYLAPKYYFHCLLFVFQNPFPPGVWSVWIC